MHQGRNNKNWLAVLLLGASLLWGCAPSLPESSPAVDIENNSQESLDTVRADVISTAVTGGPKAYQFAVEVSSPDTGCEQYADWWEILTEQEELVYRRILDHSHVDEQPFVRSGGPVEIDADTVVIIRAHMNSGGYAGNVLKGSVQAGFEAVGAMPDFAKNVERQPPLPASCAF